VVERLIETVCRIDYPKNLRLPAPWSLK
jgi:hypothetical protein